MKNEARDAGRERRSHGSPEEEPLAALWHGCVESEARTGAAEAESWALLVARVQPYLCSILQHRLGTLGRDRPEEVDEALQDVYCRLIANDYRAMRALRADRDGEVLAYLKRVALSVVNDQERWSRARKRAVDMTSTLKEVASGEAGAERRLLLQELRSLLLQECRRVASPRASDRDVWIFERAVLDGWSSSEIAKWVKLRAASIDAVVCRMRQKLAGRGLHVPSRC